MSGDVGSSAAATTTLVEIEPHRLSALPPARSLRSSSAELGGGLDSVEHAVLFVGASPVIGGLVEQTLDGVGLKTTSVTSDAGAIAWLSRNAPTLVLIDLMTSGPDAHDGDEEPFGLQTLRQLRIVEHGSRIPVVVLAGLDQEREVALAFDAGADDCVRKPFRPGELVARAKGLLRLRRTVDELERRTRDAELLVDLTQALASSLDLRQILFTVVVRIAEVVRVDRVSIVLVREAEETGFVVVSSDDRELRDRAIDLRAYPEIRRALADKQPLVIPNAETHPLLAALRRDTGRPTPFTSLAIVPLMFEERPMGVLFLRSRSPATFDDRALSLCKTLANATAVGLRNARILQSLRDQTQQITFARYEAERRMRSLQRYADFFESIDDGVGVMDLHGALLFANPRAKELTGYDESDLRERTLIEVVAPDDLERAINVSEQLKQRVYPRGVDLRVVRRDGATRIFSFTFSSVLHEEEAVLFTLRDVTSERAGAIELAETKDFLELLIDSSVDAIVSADMKGRIVIFNRAAERVFGLSASEVLGSGVERLYPLGVAKRIMALIRADEYGGKGRLEGYRTEFLSATCELIPISLSAAVIRRGERAIGTVGIFVDLRERLRIEQRLAHAQEQLRIQEKQTIVAELAGAAAHELNQPLTSVMGYAELLRRRLDAGTSQHHAASIIVNEAERMAEIVRKIGKITRYETKTYVGSARILDLDRASVGHMEAVRAPIGEGSKPPSSDAIPEVAPRAPGARIDQRAEPLEGLPIDPSTSAAELVASPQPSDGRTRTP